jgi:hypothetical protein
MWCQLLSATMTPLSYILPPKSIFTAELVQYIVISFAFALEAYDTNAGEGGAPEGIFTQNSTVSAVLGKLLIWLRLP